MIKPVDFQARVSEVFGLTSKVKGIRFIPNFEDFVFEAGQFVMIKFANPDNPSEELQRAYSVANRPGEEFFEFCYDIIPGGKGSGFLLDLKVGDNVHFKGPFGLCVVKNPNDILTVATGTGIAPIKAILEDLATKKDSRKIDLFFGFRHEEDIFYMDQLEKLKVDLPGLNIFLTLSQPKSPTWEKLTGRVTVHLADYDFTNREVFICGNGNMVRDVRNLSLAKGIDKRNIHVEIFDV